MAWETSAFRLADGVPFAADVADNEPVTALAYALDALSGLDDVQPENRVNGFLLSGRPRLRVIDGDLSDCVRDFDVDVRKVASAKPYAYVAGNPLNRSDPSGMISPTDPSGPQVWGQLNQECGSWNAATAGSCYAAANCSDAASCIAAGTHAYQQGGYWASVSAATDGCAGDHPGMFGIDWQSIAHNNALQNEQKSIQAGSFAFQEAQAYSNEYSHSFTDALAGAAGVTVLAGAALCGGSGLCEVVAATGGAIYVVTGAINEANTGAPG